MGWNKSDTYESTPGDIVACSLTGFPNSSNGGKMSKVDSIDEKIVNSDRFAMNIPGQILSMLYELIMS